MRILRRMKCFFKRRVYLIKNSLRKPLNIGDDVFYLVNSFHNGRENAHYRVYHSKVMDISSSKFCVGEGFWFYDFELCRTKKKAQKKARRLNAKK